MTQEFRVRIGWPLSIRLLCAIVPSVVCCDSLTMSVFINRLSEDGRMSCQGIILSFIIIFVCSLVRGSVIQSNDPAQPSVIADTPSGERYVTIC